MSKTTRKTISATTAEKCRTMAPILNALLDEVKELSKKKQDETLNKLKVDMINKVLTEIRTQVLQDEPILPFLHLLDSETLPSNSDAVLVLAQYKAGLSQLQTKIYQSQKSNTGQPTISRGFSISSR